MSVLAVASAPSLAATLTHSSQQPWQIADICFMSSCSWPESVGNFVCRNLEDIFKTPIYLKFSSYQLIYVI